MLVALCGVVGLAVGSFLNVVVYRVPQGLSVVRPASACPVCGHPIRARDNVPVLSWIALRGRCRDCAAPISVQYPLVELATAVAFGLTACWTGLSWTLPLYLYAVALGLALTVIDLQVRRLPDALVLPSYPVMLALLTLATVDPGSAAHWGTLLHGAAGLAILGGGYLLLAVIRPDGMGMGDVKLAGLLGLLLGSIGWGAVIIGGFAAFLLGGAYGVAVVAARRSGRGTSIPFGPWMVLGAVVGVVAGPTLWNGYLALI